MSATEDKWHYIEYDDNISTADDILWFDWLEKNVGKKRIDYKWDDQSGHYFICFKREEDAVAFRLRFKI